MNERLWQPARSQIDSANLTSFAIANGITDTNYEKLHLWSTDSREAFWRSVWDHTGIVGNRGDTALAHGDNFFTSSWFPQARLNFAENLVRYDDERTAIVTMNESGERRALSYSELRRKTAQFANELRSRGIEPGDRVVGWLPNIAETVIAMLATSSIGAVWSSCSPDFGVPGALDRFGQIEPKLLIACDGYQYNRHRFDVAENARSVAANIESISDVIWYSTTQDNDFSKIFSGDEPDLQFEHLPFDHPLYVMYSSGTTGKPKCIVHGAGGTLIQHLKEHQLHVNLTRDDVLFFFTTTGWMMWNWLVSGLATGCTVVLYDGSPFVPTRRSLVDLIDQEHISVFGVGAKYISSIEKVRVKPKARHSLETLKSILSTGSPLSHESFEYVYDQFKEDVWLASISGGTDLISCFVLGNPWSPVYKGEIQGPGLGMAVEVLDDSGTPVFDQKGELACMRSFPSAPIGFWNDPDDRLYRSAYFERFDDVWAHGDFAERLSNSSGFVIHGRSDAVLNPGGVRIGTAEIYRQVESLDSVKDAVCVGQTVDDDVRVVLFLTMNEGFSFSNEIAQEIKKRVRTNTSPRHVPDVILAVEDIPMTRSGKIAELAVRDAIHGREVKNTSALANPESLDFFRNLPELQH